jgi:hypothetical protein
VFDIAVHFPPIAFHLGDPLVARHIVNKDSATVFSFHATFPPRIVAFDATHPGRTHGPHCHFSCAFLQSGVTPLMMAANKGHLHILSELLDCGTRVDAKDNDVSVVRNGVESVGRTRVPFLSSTHFRSTVYRAVPKPS